MGNHKSHWIKNQWDNKLGIFEECVSIDKDILQQVLIPIANISRRCMDGSKHSEEPLNQSELYIKLFWTNVNILFTLSLPYNIRRVKNAILHL